MLKYYGGVVVMTLICAPLSNAHAVYCAAQCSSHSSFCANSTQWCGSSGGTISQNPAYVYCMPFQGDVSTPTASTWIICFDDQTVCNNRNWKASGTDKEYSAGLSCSSIGTARPVGPSNRWRCARGYYSQNGKTNIVGSSSSAITCVSCLESGITAGPGAVAITECYLAANTLFEDNSGNGVYMRNCPYVK